MTRGTAKSFRTSFVKLEDEGRDRVPRRADSLPLKQLKTAPVVLQPRDIDHAFLDSEQHTKTLTEAIVEAPENVLEPLTVWWSGQHWYVIDGHHRLDAYKRAATRIKLPSTIPVKTFEGTLGEAIRASAALNCRDKLRMTKADKWERAWKLVCLPDKWTREEIHRDTGTSIRTIATMRAKKAELTVQGKLNLLDTIWAEVKRGEPAGKDEDWAEEMAIDWGKRLVRTFGDQLARQPEVAARAIELYSPRLMSELIEWWTAKEDEVEDTPPTVAEAEPESIEF